MADAYRWPLGLCAIPEPNQSANPSSFTLNQSTDQLEYIFAADDAITITKLGIRQTTLTGTAPVFRVSLQGVDGSGLPDGSIKNSGNAYNDYTPTTGNNTTFQWLTLGASYACSRGELLALVIAYQSGTIDGSNNCSFGTVIPGTSGAGFPYTIQNDAGSRSRQTNNIPVFGYASSSRAYGRPIQSGASANYNTGTTPDEFGMKFTTPAGWCDTFKVLGVRALLGPPASTTVRLTLYDTDGTTALQQVDRDTDVHSGGNPRMQEIIFDESSLSALTAGSTYRVTLTPQNASNLSGNYIEVAAAADWDAMPGGGQSFHWTQRTDAGAWTDTTTRRAVMELILTDITEPSGGGGLAGPVVGLFGPVVRGVG